MKFAVVLFAVLLAGCTTTSRGQPLPDPMGRTADVIVQVVPRMTPVVEALQAERIATSSNELMTLTLYFRTACADWQDTWEYRWSPSEMRADMAANTGKRITDAQAVGLAVAFDQACYPFGSPK